MALSVSQQQQQLLKWIIQLILCFVLALGGTGVLKLDSVDFQLADISPLSLSLSHSPSLTLPLSLSLSHSPSLTLPLSLSLSHSPSLTLPSLLPPPPPLPPSLFPLPSPCMPQGFRYAVVSCQSLVLTSALLEGQVDVESATNFSRLETRHQVHTYMTAYCHCISSSHGMQYTVQSGSREWTLS